MIMPQTDSPPAGFRPFLNPATGEWITYTALAVTTGIAAGVILLGTAAAGFHDLAGLRPARRPGPASPGTKG